MSLETKQAKSITNVGLLVVTILYTGKLYHKTKQSFHSLLYSGSEMSKSVNTVISNANYVVFVKPYLRSGEDIQSQVETKELEQGLSDISIMNSLQ